MKPDLLRHLALSLFGASAARVLYFVMLPLAARFYSKDDFGGLALAVGLVGLVQPLLTLRYEIAVVLSRSTAAARAILWGALGLAACGYLIAALAVLAAPRLLASFVDPALIVRLRAPVLLFLAANVTNVVLTAWLQRRADFRTTAAAQFTGALTTFALVLGIPVVATASLTGLVWSYAIGALASLAVLASGTAGTRLSILGHAADTRRIPRLLIKYRVYPTYSLPLTFSSLFSDRVLLLYLSSAFSLATLGGFFSIRQLLFGMVQLVTSSISQVVFAHVARTGRGVLAVRLPLLAMTRGIAVVAGLGLGWVTPHATDAVRWLFGPQWLDAAHMAPWIAAHGAVNAVTGWQGRLLDVERRQRLDATLQICSDLAMVVGIGALWASSVSATAAVAIVSLIGVFGGIGWITVVYRVTRLGVWQALGSMGLLFVVALVASGVGLVLGQLLGAVPGMLASLAATIVAAALVLAVTAKAISREIG